MKQCWNLMQGTITILGGWLGYYLGGWDGVLIALIVFMTIDYLTGVLCAINDKKLSSEVGFKGISKKVMILMLVGIAHFLDELILGASSVLRNAVIFYYLSNEGLSILENAAHLGLPVPEQMQDVLEQLHNRADKEESDHDEGN